MVWTTRLHTSAMHPIYLITGARPFKSAPYRAGRKARELEEFETKRQLAAGLMEHSNA